MRRTGSFTAAVLVATLALAGCGDDDKSTAAAPAADGVTTGPGISDSTITLGVLTDRTGVFKDFGLALDAGHAIWLDEVNAAGGICGRQVQLESRDHGYKADAAKLHFADVEPKIAAFLDVLGSPVIAALQQDVRDAQITTVVTSYSSFILDNPFLVMPGTSFDVDMINGLSYLLQKQVIKAGDTIGHVHLEGELGENALAGAEYFAKRHDIQLRSVKVVPTDTDMTGVVTSLRGAKVDAIALSTTPPQTASIAAANQALGLKVPMIASFPGFVPQLLTTPAASALSALYVVASVVPFSSDVPNAKAVREAFEAGGFDAVPNLLVNLGYAFGEIMGGVLDRACTNKNLTREGIQAALKQSTQISTGGLTPALDFSTPGEPPSRETYVAQVDAKEKGGMRQLDKAAASPDAKAYVAPHQGVQH